MKVWEPTTASGCDGCGNLQGVREGVGTYSSHWVSGRVWELTAAIGCQGRCGNLQQPRGVEIHNPWDYSNKVLPKVLDSCVRKYRPLMN